MAGTTSGASLVTFGETMAAMRSSGPLRLGGDLRLSVAGAESNVAIGLARLGHSAAWTGRVGDDELGALVLRTLRAEGVDTGGVIVDPGAPTGLLIFEPRLSDVTRVQYYRAGSAGSRLEPADLDTALPPAPAADLAGLRSPAPGDARAAAPEPAPGSAPAPPAPGLAHLTGITPALSVTAAQAARAGARRARETGRLVSFDVNYRARLWPTERAREELPPLAAMASIIFASEQELRLLSADPRAAAPQAADELLGNGAAAVVVKRGAEGATAYTAAGAVSVPARRVRVADVIGAGDAFVAGYLSGVLDGLDVTGCLGRGAAVSAFGVATTGDWEGLPTRAELGLLGAEEEAVR
jgi:2-dehydro-3-deoxygluconokinase